MFTTNDIVFHFIVLWVDVVKQGHVKELYLIIFAQSLMELHKQF